MLKERSRFFVRLRQEVERRGGMHNAHLHLDRAFTLDDAYLAEAHVKVLESSFLSLHRKHHLINAIHNGPAYIAEDLTERVDHTLDAMVAAGTRRADTMVDTTDDGVGLSALEILGGIRDRRRQEIDLRIAAYSPLGFRDDAPERWRLLEAGAEIADFIGCLPEADDRAEYPEHIGFDEHLARMLDLARRHGKMLHVHTDQRNEASEDGTERLIRAVRRDGAPRADDGDPMVWAIHMVSPATYDEARHRRLVEGLRECNIGVVSCPSAALGMRQLRPLASPTGNSIPRILELVAAGVHVRLGSDNIADICSPSTTADLYDEVFILSAALRYYDPDILAALACGDRLDAGERETVAAHLRRNEDEIAKALAALSRPAAADLDRADDEEPALVSELRSHA